MDGKKNNIAKWVDRGINVCFYLCLLVVAYVVLQVFVVTSFSIPSDSMEPTLLPGDKILVEKCATGARLFDLPAALAREEVKIYRVPGWRKFRRNDVLVFNFPYREGRWDSIAFDVTKYFVKRCIALPGDTVEIRGGYYHLRGVDAPAGNLQAQAQVAALTEADTQLSLGQDLGLDDTALRPAGGAEAGADGAFGSRRKCALPAAHQLRTKEVAGLAGGGRLHRAGRQRGDGIYVPRGLLFHGGRQGAELAGLPLLGAAAGKLHRGQGVCRMVVGR